MQISSTTIFGFCILFGPVHTRPESHHHNRLLLDGTQYSQQSLHNKAVSGDKRQLNIQKQEQLRRRMSESGDEPFNNCVVYRNRTDWENAVGGNPTWMVDFQDFTEDTPIGNTTLGTTLGIRSTSGATVFTISAENWPERYSEEYQLVDVPPHYYNSYGRCPDFETSKTLNLAINYEWNTKIHIDMVGNPLDAWGYDYCTSHLGSEVNGLEIVDGPGGFSRIFELDKQLGFFGFHCPGNSFDEIVFKSPRVGDDHPAFLRTFLLDNIVAHTSNHRKN